MSAPPTVEAVIEAARALEFSAYPAHGSGYVTIVAAGDIGKLKAALAAYDDELEARRPSGDISPRVTYEGCPHGQCVQPHCYGRCMDAPTGAIATAAEAREIYLAWMKENALGDKIAPGEESLMRAYDDAIAAARASAPVQEQHIAALREVARAIEEDGVDWHLPNTKLSDESLLLPKLRSLLSALEAGGPNAEIERLTGAPGPRRFAR